MQDNATQWNVLLQVYFYSVESSQASQMHLVRSHDKAPDLFVDNDGSALMILFDILMTMVIILIMIVVVMTMI